MKFLYFVIISLFFLSCGKKDVKVPVNDNPGLHEVWDNSPIYILMKISDGDTISDLKLGQTMSTTHWLIAVDRRLKMNSLVKPLEKILKKRHKKSIHSKEGTHAYFTYLDSLQKKISFIDFDSIVLKTEYKNSKQYFQKYFKDDEKYQKFHLFIDKEQIIFNDTIKFNRAFAKNKIHDSIWQLIGQKTGEMPNRLYLNFDKHISFNRFLDYYTFFKNNPVPKGKLSNKLFIIDKL